MRDRSTLVRSLPVAAAILLGSSLVFALGVRAGSQLDHRTRTVSVVPAPLPTTIAHR